MYFLLLFITVSFAFAGSPQIPPILPEDSVKIVAARRQILEIWKAAQIYDQDRGEWPDSIGVLVNLSYLKLDSAVNADWRFGAQFPASIQAQQKYLAKNARKDGYGAPHSVTYDIETGYWIGSGELRPILCDPSFNIQEVQSAMYGLASARMISYQDRGTYSSVVQLDKDRYVSIPTSVKINWQIRMQDDSIVARSTDWMPDGPDKVVVYYPKERRFSGYGVSDPHNIPQLTPYLEYAPAKKIIR